MLALATLFFGLTISITAAYFSIIGLATMFPGSVVSIIIMGSSLEIGKILAAIWLHTKWRALGFLVKIYLIIALIVLMLITSMGIFGFLSKSYVMHEAESEKQKAKIQQIENKIERQRFLIEQAQKIVNSQIDKSKNTADKITVFIKQEEDRILKLNDIAKESIVQEESNINRWKTEIQTLNQIIFDLEKKSGLFSNNKKKIEAEQIRQAPILEELNKKISLAEESIQEIKKSNQDNIKEITQKIKELQNSIIVKTSGEDSDTDKANKKIDEAQSIIDKLSLEKFDILNASRELEAEIGPVKYVVELFQDISSETVTIGFAIRCVILSLIFVFDPLALVLIVTSISFLDRKSLQETTFSERKKVFKNNLNWG